MHTLLTFVVIGLPTGSVYGLVGSGLALTYKTSGIFNFGYGAIAPLPVNGRISFSRPQDEVLGSEVTSRYISTATLVAQDPDTVGK